MKKLIVIMLLVFPSLGLNMFSPKNILNFADFLYEQKDYLRASGEYLRYLYGDSYGTKAGFTLEKDPGEQWVSLNRNVGFDFNSGFVTYQDQKKKYRLLLGDYHLRFGQVWE